MEKHMENNQQDNAFRKMNLREKEMASNFQHNTLQKVPVMQKNRSWKNIRIGLLTAAAIMMILSAAMGTAWAYFTTYATARGGVTISLGHEDEITEKFSNWKKTLKIASKEGSSVPVYVRARGYYADNATSPLNYSGTNWIDGGDGWQYYTQVLEPEGVADDLIVSIPPREKGSMSGYKENDTFNVIVVYESTEVQLDDDGNRIAPEKADWSRKVDTTERASTLGGGD